MRTVPKYPWASSGQRVEKSGYAEFVDAEHVLSDRAIMRSGRIPDQMEDSAAPNNPPVKAAITPRIEYVTAMPKTLQDRVEEDAALFPSDWPPK